MARTFLSEPAKGKLSETVKTFSSIMKYTQRYNVYQNIFIFIFKYFTNSFLERREGRGKERETNIDVREKH